MNHSFQDGGYPSVYYCPKQDVWFSTTNYKAHEKVRKIKIKSNKAVLLDLSYQVRGQKVLGLVRERI